MILRNFVSRLQRCPCRVPSFSTSVDSQSREPTPDVKPTISTREYLDDYRLYQKRREVWLESLETVPEKKLGLVSLHPDIFATRPRMDILWQNIRWQRMYQHVVSPGLDLHCRNSSVNQLCRRHSRSTHYEYLFDYSFFLFIIKETNFLHKKYNIMRKVYKYDAIEHYIIFVVFIYMLFAKR